MKRLFFAFVLISLFTYACSSDDTAEENADSLAACKTKPLNPNGDSELAILMREMANWTDSCKIAFENGDAPLMAPTSFASLKTAQRTDSTIDESLFLSMASLYEYTVARYSKAKDYEEVEFYNAMVTACADCHKNFCQGPLVRINKMYFQ
jgi:hypothetical protein